MWPMYAGQMGGWASMGILAGLIWLIITVEVILVLYYLILFLKSKIK